MIEFIAGVILGAAAVFGYAYYMNSKTSHQSGRPERPPVNLQLARCKQRFGQISTRESIREVRKIAQQAIKELS